MDTNLIIKLIKLANNNPNDNEANLAARKVCKMLTDYKFPAPAVMDKDSLLNDIFQASKRQEAYYKGQNSWYTPGRPPPGNTREAKQGEKETASKPHADNPNADPFREYREKWAGIKYTDEFFDEAYEEFMKSKWKKEESNPYAENIKRNLKCKTCGHTKATRFRGSSDNWVCMECRGKEYMKDEKKV